jgi:hypothetical protein
MVPVSVSLKPRELVCFNLSLSASSIIIEASSSWRFSFPDNTRQHFRRASLPDHNLSLFLMYDPKEKWRYIKSAFSVVSSPISAFRDNVQ